MATHFNSGNGPYYVRGAGGGAGHHGLVSSHLGSGAGAVGRDDVALDSLNDDGRQVTAAVVSGALQRAAQH